MIYVVFIAGLLLGVLAQRAWIRHAPGRPVQPFEQAIIKRNGALVRINGPAWLKVADTLNLVGIYDISDKRRVVHVEPAHAQLPTQHSGEVAKQRFYLDIVVIYRPVAMDLVLRLDDIEEWMDHHVRAAVRDAALTLMWNELSNGQEYVSPALARLQAMQASRGIEIVEMFPERIAVRPPSEMQSIAYGGNARHLGKEGLQLTYLEALKDIAAQPSTKILLPADLAGDAEIALRTENDQ